MDTNSICGILNEYLFQKVWNQDYEDSKLSARLFRWIEKSVNGAIHTPAGAIYLPTLNEPYYIYMVDFTKLSYLDLGITEEWSNLFTINNASDYEIRIINSGKILYSKNIYLCRYAPTNDIFLVISKKMFHAICGENTELDIHNNLIRKEKYTDILVRKETENVTVNSIFIESIMNRVTALGYCNETNTCMLLNGQKYNTITYNMLTTGCYLEVINDTNVIANYTIDLTTNRSEFLSSDDNKLYVICHTPKASNINNYVITPNLIEIYVFAKHSNNVLSNGVLLFSSTIKTKQITHNDFGISNDLLLAYSDLIGSNELILNVQCRAYPNTHTLIRDKNYIDLLYKHTDSEIFNFLNGKGSAILNFWVADVLASSNYIKYLTSFPTYVDSSNLNTFIDTFGYQQILAILTDRLRTFVYGNSIQYPFVVQTPPSFNGDALPVLYRNGIKINNEDLIVDKLLEGRISIEAPLTTFHDGDKCIIELFEKTNFNNISFIPTFAVHSITLNTNNYNVYLREQTSVAIKGLNETFNYSYVLDTSHTVIQNGDTYIYSFNTNSYNKQYIFIPKDGVYSYTKDLQQSITNIDPLYMTLELPVVNETFNIPLLGVNTSLVTINGKELVKGIDYKIIEVKDGTKIVACQVVVYNVGYLTDTNNILEVIADRSESYITSNFFNSEDENSVPNVLNWFDTISTAFCDGSQIFGVSSDGADLLIVDPHRSGALVGTRTMFSESTRQFIEEYKSDEDDARYIALVEYFIQKNPPYLGVVTIPYAHTLYSVKLCVIIRDILNGNFSLMYDPDPQRMLVQIQEYDYLDVFDIINDQLDKRFIDYNPVYREVSVINPTVYNLIDYMGRTLIDDPITYSNGALS